MPTAKTPSLSQNVQMLKRIGVCAKAVVITGLISVKRHAKSVLCVNQRLRQLQLQLKPVGGAEANPNHPHQLLTPADVGALVLVALANVSKARAGMGVSANM